MTGIVQIAVLGKDAQDRQAHVTIDVRVPGIHAVQSAEHDVEALHNGPDTDRTLYILCILAVSSSLHSDRILQAVISVVV